MSSLPAVTDQNFATEVGNFEGITLVDFWAPWCTPCLAMAPHLERMAEKYAADPRVKIVQMNIDENTETAFGFRVLSIPTFKIFNKGTEVDEVIGAVPPVKLEEALLRALGPIPAAAQ